MGLLTGKTALVTGAARGIGKAVAMKFASEGANIAFTDLVLNDDMAAGLEATRKEIEALGVTCRAYAGNAADFEETEKTVKQILDEAGTAVKAFHRFSKLLPPFLHARLIVQCRNQNGALFSLTRVSMFLNELPMVYGSVYLALPFAHQSEIEARLHKPRRQHKGLLVGLPRAFDVALAEQHCPQIEPGKLVVRGVWVTLQPCSIQHSHQARQIRSC